MTLLKYPRTRHIEGSRLQTGDLGDDKPIAELRDLHLAIEEKVDGANSGLSFLPDGTPRLQSRGHFLTGGYRERHFDMFKTWASVHAQALFARLGTRYTMYGEWMFAKHTVFYDALTHYYLEFDVFDHDAQVFLSTSARRALLDGLPIMPVPVLFEGTVNALAQIEALVRPSLYKTPDWRVALERAAEKSGSRADFVEKQRKTVTWPRVFTLKSSPPRPWLTASSTYAAISCKRSPHQTGIGKTGLSCLMAWPTASTSLRLGLGWKGRMMRSDLTHDTLRALVPTAPDWRVDWEVIWPLTPEFGALDSCPQDPIHHAEGDAGIHTRMVVESLVAHAEWRNLPLPEREMLFWAACSHDIGKPATTRHEDDGRITSRGHSRVGAAITRGLLRESNIPFPVREAICGIIEKHQLPFWLIERPAPDRMAIQTSLLCRPDLLCLHAEADALGRVCEDQAAVLENVALARLTFAEAGCATDAFPFANDESRLAFLESDERSAQFAAHEEFRCTATVMSGLPGSGKDTWIAQNCPDLPMVSLDVVREALGISPTDNQGSVIQAAFEAARVHLRANQDFVWNATNVTAQTRGKMLRLLRDYAARIRIVYIEVPPKQLIRQNAARPDAVPDAVVQKLERKLEPPRLTECHELLLVV